MFQEFIFKISIYETIRGSINNIPLQVPFEHPSSAHLEGISQLQQAKSVCHAKFPTTFKNEILTF